MPVSDVAIHRAARLWLHQNGDDALSRAGQMVDVMRRKGDSDGADTWLRIIVAIGTLGTPPTN